MTTGPGRSNPTSGDLPAPRRRLGGRIEVVVIATLVCGLALFTAGLVGYGLAGDPTPRDTSAEAGFARDMQTHHQQAVQMSFLIRERSDDPAIRTLAYDIITSQQQQSGQMYGWLTQWGLPQTSPDPPMAWMSDPTASRPSKSTGRTPNMEHSSTPMPRMSGIGTMPGMASPADLQRLESSKGPAAERLFLKLMIDHHRGGVSMADAVLDRTQRPEVRALASAIVTAQSAEITQMQKLLQRVST
ncbi:MAG TPA: DUF305 domain-containing protein [Marmoricola sp.]|nr:DUF305 domain-containing protein [Marmoricola sp.]